ncbi:MAG TPA: multidrug transporter [Acinetobacter sp.]|uniref:EamA-like transporter family protein n=1 Tax=Acinetobacter venetianus TaxID=52133 RepID=A0A150HSJ6_9GAMM|nr:DMT family transporter [Acinetobacter venetianus]KXZ63814.1 EamA-like transporter family protein [Acinetobacter venetianus]KXZ69675.1 EamA-like transporter family protein [Acinetobacter venetianus]HBO72110.1 multidrug transporter [Acinetobacter sp.]HIQ36361.1 multidrug transporter [Acinetobacter venetianus]
MAFTWILFTIMAAFMQAWRNAFQKQLSTSVDAYGTTLARFLFSPLFAFSYLAFLYVQKPVTAAVHFSDKFWFYIVIAGVSQIFATALMVMLFQQKNYAIGVGLAKSEAILAAIVGVIFLQEHLTTWGWVGVLIGAVAVFLLSKGRQHTELSMKTLMIGLGSGLCFAITSLLVREASLELTMLPFLHRAAWVLCCLISFQCIIMLLYLGIFSRETLYRMWQRLGLVFKVSVCSFLASVGWFSAMSMQTVAIVKTLGQVEILFSLLISAFFFKEKLAKTDHLGLWLVIVAAIMVIWA